MDVYELRWSVRGYHVYREIWGAASAEVLACARETENVSDRYAVAVVNNDKYGRGSPRNRKRVAIFRRFKFCRAVLHYENYEINTPTKFTRYTVFVYLKYLYQFQEATVKRKASHQELKSTSEIVRL